MLTNNSFIKGITSKYSIEELRDPEKRVKIINREFG